MLLFVYVLGGAINTGSHESYINYLPPGILLITIASRVAYTSYRLFLDLQSGIFERFQSMPIARSSVLWAHVLTSVVDTIRALFNGQPVGFHIWVALAWLVGVAVVAYIAATRIYRHKMR